MYKWRHNGSFEFEVTSPGETTIDGFDSAEFLTFEDFQSNIIGTWSVSSQISNATSTFEIISFEASDFVMVELLYPTEGQNFLDMEAVQIEASPATNNFSIFVPNGATSQLLGNGAFQVNLNKDTSQVAARTAAIVNEFRVDIISSIAGDTIAAPISQETRVASRSPSTTIIVSDSTSFLGDVNRDGTLNLLDVSFRKRSRQRPLPT